MTHPFVKPNSERKLDPGRYWIDLQFDVPTPSASVRDGLAMIGFLDVKLDAEISPENSRRTVSFLGRIDAPVLLRDVPGVTWEETRKLAIDPFEPLPYRARAFPLKTNSLYEVRFLSRDKRAKHRGDVTTLLEAIGLLPIGKLFLCGRDMRVPGRPNVSVSEWLAIGRWSTVSSVTTVEEPLFFSDVKEKKS